MTTTAMTPQNFTALRKHADCVGRGVPVDNKEKKGYSRCISHREEIICKFVIYLIENGYPTATASLRILSNGDRLFVPDLLRKHNREYLVDGFLKQIKDLYDSSNSAVVITGAKKERLYLSIRRADLRTVVKAACRGKIQSLSALDTASENNGRSVICKLYYYCYYCYYYYYC